MNKDMSVVERAVFEAAILQLGVKIRKSDKDDVLASLDKAITGYVEVKDSFISIIDRIRKSSQKESDIVRQASKLYGACSGGKIPVSYICICTAAIYAATELENEMFSLTEDLIKKV